MKVKIAKAAIKQYIEFLQQLEDSADTESVELEFAIFSSSTGRSTSAKLSMREVMYADYGRPAAPELSVVLGASRPSRSAKETLRSKLRGAGTLIVCDPYLLTLPRGIKAKEYIHDLMSVLPLKTLRHLDIVLDKTRESPGVRLELSRQWPKSVTLQLFDDSSIHDRVWIIDEHSAFVVGTSFGGIGKKLAFLLRLPPDDLENFKKYLQRSRKPVGGSVMASHART